MRDTDNCLILNVSFVIILQMWQMPQISACNISLNEGQET